MNKDCTCGVDFRDAEDWRDHMPCPGSELEMALVELAHGKFIAGEVGDQNCLLEMENDRLRKEIQRLNGLLMERSNTSYREDREWIHSNDLPCSICGVWDCPGAARFKGICPEYTKSRLNTKCI